MKVLIIGGVAGGATVAARLRRLDEKAEIIIFEKGEHISYANCGLPYYIGDVIKERNALFLQTPTSFDARFNVEIRILSEVTEINPKNRTVLVKSVLSGNQYHESYDKLVLSPGAEPVRPAIEGIDLPQIFTLRDVKDSDRMKEYIQSQHVKKAAVVGAGFIGLEMVENLHNLGIDVSVIEKSSQVMPSVDPSIATILRKQLKDKNVSLVLNDSVVSFSSLDPKIRIQLHSGKVLDVDMVVLSVGVKPANELAKKAGLKIGHTDGIWVNECLQTSDPDIYAIGDAIEFPSPVIGKSFLSLLAGPANKQARICANNIHGGNKERYRGSVSTAIAKVFDLTVASTGVSEKILKENNIEFITSVIHSYDHATYYPNPTQMTLKVNFAPETGRLLGAQVIGTNGVDKRIDLFATVIGNGGTVSDLTDIEHAYAPPFSSPRDPVNVAGYVAENILNKRMIPIHPHELQELENALLIDVRSALEFKAGSIRGALNYPLDELRESIEDIPRDKTIVVYCAIGLRGHLASRILLQAGFEKVYNLSGGYKSFEAMQESEA